VVSWVIGQQCFPFPHGLLLTHTPFHVAPFFQ
jgi:hypothetical protein